MHFKNITLDEFSVIGISVRTTNKNGQSQKDIGELWSRFMQGNISAQISNKLSDNLYCIYTEYESDYQGAYTTILGYKVSTIGNLSDGLIGKNIPNSRYRMYLSEGVLPQSIMKTWSHIWESDIDRKYLADFDVYTPNAFSSESPIVETYLSV